MHDRDSRNKNRRRHCDRNLRYLRSSVKSRQQRSRRSEPNCQHERGANVYPEQVTRQKVVNLVSLQDGIGKSHASAAHKQHAERGDHRNHAEVARHQKASQNDRSYHLNGKCGALRENSDAGTPHGATTQSAGLNGRQPRASGIEGFQSHPWCELRRTCTLAAIGYSRIFIFGSLGLSHDQDNSRAT